MRLKTQLVLAITTLVFLIAGVVSLVYASQLLHAAVQQSYDTNHMVAEQIRFALQNALETGLRDQTVNPNDPGQLRAPDDRGGARQCRVAGGGSVGQSLLAYRLRHQHRRQPFRHAAQHQS